MPPLTKPVEYDYFTYGQDEIAAMSSNSREKSSYWIPIRQELSQHWEAGDAFVLADAYLLSVREDDATLVDSQWLLTVGFHELFNCIRHETEKDIIWWAGIETIVFDRWEITKPTRGQMRSVCKLFGITLKE